MQIKHNRLAVGTTRGVLATFNFDGNRFIPEIEFTAHLPDRSKFDSKFGSLRYYSEI